MPRTVPTQQAQPRVVLTRIHYLAKLLSRLSLDQVASSYLRACGQPADLQEEI